MPLPILRLTVAFRFRRFAQLVGLASLLAAVPAFAENESDTQKASALLAEAYEHLTAGEAATAIEKLEQADRLADEKSVDVLLLLAIAENNVGDSNDAIDAAERALALDPAPAQAADAHFQVGLARLGRAAPRGGGPWSSRELELAEEALREAVRLEGPRALEAKAHLGYVMIRRENQKAKPEKERFDEGYALARERYEEGSPGSGMDLARFVLCGSPTCEPFPVRLPGAENEDGPPYRLHFDPQAEEGPGGVVRSDIQRPKAISTPQPELAPLARKHGIRSGQIVLEAIINEEGRVGAIRVVEGMPFGLNEVAAEQVRQWRFEPATLDGRPVAVYYNLTIRYTSSGPI